MKRWNAQRKVWERKQGERWVAVDESGNAALDTALASAFEAGSQEQAAGAQGLAEAVAPGAQDRAPTSTFVAEPPGRPGDGHPVAGDSGPGLAVGANGVGLDLEPAADAIGDLGDLSFDVPGLVSSDGGRSTGGAKSVRSRLQKLAERGRKTREGLKVEVAQKSARAVGPAVKETTERRQTSAKSRTQAPEEHKQRYVNRPAPEILAGRPLWVKELFEAHFRSDMTLQLRRQHNRMKISRQDYAIGWLTLFDKLREDPSVLRLKGGA